MKDLDKIISTASRSLKEIMERQKLNGNRLAKKIREAGFSISEPTMYAYLENPHRMRYEDIIVVATVLEIPMEVMNALLLGHEIN